MPDTETAGRKLSHIQTTLHQQVQSHAPTGFDDVRLLHRALPEVDRAEVDLSTEIFGHKLNAPLLIESMTGGTPLAAKIACHASPAVDLPARRMTHPSIRLFTMDWLTVKGCTPVPAAEPPHVQAFG